MDLNRWSFDKLLCRNPFTEAAYRWVTQEEGLRIIPHVQLTWSNSWAQTTPARSAPIREEEAVSDFLEITLSSSIRGTDLCTVSTASCEGQ